MSEQRSDNSDNTHGEHPSNISGQSEIIPEKNLRGVLAQLQETSQIAMTKLETATLKRTRSMSSWGVRSIE
jgi:hypothetical protein